jgi:AmiR/NasT family two-component response regulator
LNPSPHASWATGASSSVCHLDNLRRVDPSNESLERRVVIAEDEALIRLDLKEMLEEEGYVVVAEASDGEQAVAMAEEHRPDLVVLDVKMPLLDGISAAERIATARIAPVVVLTAFSQRELVDRARDAGAMAYLVKPFTKADLLPALEMAIARYDELTTLEAEVGDLRERLETRKLVERAKGLLQTHRGLDEAAAYRWLQRASMDQRSTIRAVSELVVAQQADTPPGEPSDVGSPGVSPVRGDRRPPL